MTKYIIMNNADNNIIIETIHHLKGSIKELKNVLFYKEEMLKKLILHQQKHCKHEWIIDSTDQINEYIECVNIRYCSLCNYTDPTF